MNGENRAMISQDALLIEHVVNEVLAQRTWLVSDKIWQRVLAVAGHYALAQLALFLVAYFLGFVLGSASVVSGGTF